MILKHKTAVIYGAGRAVGGAVVRTLERLALGAQNISSAVVNLAAGQIMD